MRDDLFSPVFPLSIRRKGYDIIGQLYLVLLNNTYIVLLWGKLYILACVSSGYLILYGIITKVNVYIRYTAHRQRVFIIYKMALTFNCIKCQRPLILLADSSISSNQSARQIYFLYSYSSCARICYVQMSKFVCYRLLF